MTPGSPLSGSCLCGACRFTATPVGPFANVCHCAMCRRWTGGMYMAVDCGSSVRFADTDALGSYKGSEWGERLFCTVCGSSLVWQMQDGTGQGVSMHAFDDPAQFALKNQWFIDKKPDNYALVNDTRCLTEAECIAMFAPDTG
ncbi:GFA family protein [Yoonia sp. R2-816]|uniref:GFA family protein n=1 Tax=Yoonia sp. R2-816 TaxID=3342638 RepID=UPI0037265E1B